MKFKNFHKYIDLLCVVLGSVLIVPGIILLINTSWIGGSLLLVSGSILIIVPLTQFLRWKRVGKGAQHSSATLDETNNKSSYLNTDYILSDEERQRIDDWWARFTPTRQDSYKTNIKLTKLNHHQQMQVKFMEFSGDFGKEVCMICKLELRLEQTKLQCPICLSLFHNDHLVSWLKKVQTCPVCGQQILQQ